MKKKQQDEDSESDWDSMSEAPPPAPKPHLEKENSQDRKSVDEAPGTDFKEALNEPPTPKPADKKPIFKFSLLKKYEPGSSIPEETPPAVQDKGKGAGASKKGAGGSGDAGKAAAQPKKNKDDRRKEHASDEDEHERERDTRREDVANPPIPTPRLPPVLIPASAVKSGTAASAALVAVSNVNKAPSEPSKKLANLAIPRRSPPSVDDDAYDEDFSTRVEVDASDHEAEADEKLRRRVDSLFSKLRLPCLVLVYALLGLFRTVVTGIFVPLVFGLVSVFGDHVWAPGLRLVRTLILAPLAAFSRDLAAFLRDATDPLWQGLATVMRGIAEVVRAFRLVEVNYGPQSGGDVPRENWSFGRGAIGRPHDI